MAPGEVHAFYSKDHGVDEHFFEMQYDFQYYDFIFLEINHNQTCEIY